MWKIIVLTTFFIATQATNIEKFYGEWAWVAYYPVYMDKRICLYYLFTKYTGDERCTCADGKNTTLVLTTVKKHPELEGFGPIPVPMLEVDSPDEVSVNVNCKCGDREFNDRAVVRSVNKDFFILFENMPSVMTRTDKEPNKANIFSRNIPTPQELSDVIASLDELKQRHGVTLCTTEV